MSYIVNNLWKPDKTDLLPPKKNISKQRNRNNRKRSKERRQRERIRADLLKHFGLQKYATNMAICFCIHKKTERPLPDNDRQIKKMMEGYWGSINGSVVEKKRFQTPGDFYNSTRWKELRYIALQQSGGTCTLCGATAKDGVTLHVDHIIPRSRCPEKQYDLDNLQILCEDCNMGKSNYDDTDFR